MHYLTKAGVKFLNEALTRRQKLAIGGTAGLATLFGASRVGGKVSSPTPPRPNIVHQQSQRVGPEVLQRPTSSQASQASPQPKRTAISSIEDKEAKQKAFDAKNRLITRQETVERWRKNPPNYIDGHTVSNGHHYSKKAVEHMLNLGPLHKDYGRRAEYVDGKFKGYSDN